NVTAVRNQVAAGLSGMSFCCTRSNALTVGKLSAQHALAKTSIWAARSRFGSVNIGPHATDHSPEDNGRMVSSLEISSGPGGPAGKLVSVQRSWLHLRAVAGTRWGKIPATSNLDRVNEMFVQMIHIFDHSIFHRSAHGNEIKHREMLDMFAQSHPAGVRTDRDAKLRGQ